MNCLSHALNAWHEHGGALRVVRSAHWGMPHAQDIGGYVIAAWTRSAYSHCELVVDGWLDLLTQQVLRLPVDDPGLLCSELCALMLGLPESTARGMSPG